MTLPVAISDLYKRAEDIISEAVKHAGSFEFRSTMYLTCVKGANTLTSLDSKNLTWRDMQHLVVRTSNPAHLSTNDWKINGVGRRGKSPSRCF